MRHLIGHRTVDRAEAGLVVALLLAACGTTGSRSDTTRTQSAGSQTSARTVSTTTTTVTSTAPRSTSAATASAGGPRICRAAGLALRFLGRQGATGHGELGFAVRNTGAAPCRTFGYPGVQFLDAAGGALPTRSKRVTGDFFGPVPVIEIVLVPGASESFRLAVTHGNASPAGCTTAHGLQVYPPDDTAILRVSIPEGAAECGTATVSPMRPGTSAYR